MSWCAEITSRKLCVCLRAIPPGRITELKAQREPLYREVARHTVSSGAEPVSHVVRAVLDELGFTDIQVNTGAAE